MFDDVDDNVDDMDVKTATADSKVDDIHHDDDCE